MKVWLNVHTPLPKDDTEAHRREVDRTVYVQKKTEHYKDEIKIGDYAVIYEVKTDKNNGWVTVDDQPPVPAYEPRGGIVALVKIATDFRPEPRPGLRKFNGDYYVGDFTGECIRKSDDIVIPIVTFTEIDEVFISIHKKHFQPLIFGGIRELKPDECRAIEKLLNFRFP